MSQLQEDRASKEGAFTSAIEKLRNEVAQLRQERADDKTKINSLETELQSLQPKPKGRVLTLFPKLPIEVPLSIWDKVLWTPQVIAARQHFEERTKAADDGESGRRRRKQTTEKSLSYHLALTVSYDKSTRKLGAKP
jgi:hypothetical protein